jgi:hypothetical protein
MSQVKLIKNKHFSKKDVLSYIGSLGASFRHTKPSDPMSSDAFDIITQSEVHRHHIITEICRKLDTMNVEYEVID